MVLQVVSMLIACGLLLQPAGADDATPATYLGCYVDTYERALPNVKTGEPDMTIEECLAHCRSSGHPYAGLQNSNECWCGENYNRHGKAEEADCDKQCSGNSAQYCGGSYRNSVFMLSIDTSCNIALGMQSEVIGNNQLTASTEKRRGGSSNLYKAYFARLNRGNLAWRPRDRDSEPFIQVEFGALTIVKKVTTQGYINTGNSRQLFTREYTVKSSLTGNTWINIANSDKELSFNGNEDGSGTSTQTFFISVVLRYIRIYLKSCAEGDDFDDNDNDYCALRFELYGCTDEQKPVIYNTPADIIVDTDLRSSYGTAPWTPPMAKDNFGSVTLTSSHNPGDSFPIGRTKVTYTAIDAANHQVTYSFHVAVTDTEIPDVFGRMENITVVMDINSQHASVLWEPPTATDNSGEEVTMTSNYEPGHSFPIGSTTVTYIAIDASGNRAYVTFVVVVVAPKTTPAQTVRAETSTVTPTKILKSTTAETPPKTTTTTEEAAIRSSMKTDSTPSKSPSPTKTLKLAGPLLESKAGPSFGTLVGAVIGTFAVIGLFAAIVCVLIRKRRSEPEMKRGAQFNGPYELEGGILPTVASRVASPENVTYQNTQDVLEDTGNDDNTYAYADAKSRGSISTVNGRPSSSEGLVPIYAHSKYGGRPPSHVAGERAEDDYYSYADLKRKSNTSAEEGWSDNSIYAATNAGNNPGEQSVNKEGWKTNSTYASADNGSDHREIEGWEENSIYGIDD